MTFILRTSIVFTAFFHVLVIAAIPSELPDETSGVLIMAHGGEKNWNSALQKAVLPLKTFCPVEIAFGMAQRDPIQQAINRLEAQSVKKIAVVRVFISAESFRHQTEYLLGLRPDPPEKFLAHHSHLSGHSPASQIQFLNSDLAPPPVRRNSIIALNQEGLSDSERMRQVIEERVRSLSSSPANESVLVLAHGEGDDKINRLWLSKLKTLIAPIRHLETFQAVRVETLREDWQKKRERAEKQIRKFVQQQNLIGNNVIVVPFRVFGFGPYRRVLEGLDYVSNGLGLLPHPQVTRWIQEQATQCLAQIGGSNPFRDER